MDEHTFLKRTTYIYNIYFSEIIYSFPSITRMNKLKISTLF